MLDVRYNYLTGKAGKLPEDFVIDKRIDPDGDGCKELYDDLITAYFSDLEMNKRRGIHTIENREQYSWKTRKSFYTLFVNGDDYLLSADYIGPSVHWAGEKGMTDTQILDFLSICRTIGGHIVWPRGSDIKDGKTINRQRGGEKSLYDRMDWTLLLLKIFYMTDGDKERYLSYTRQTGTMRQVLENENRFLIMFEAFSRSRSWLDRFGSFEEFCKQFKLNGTGNFVTEQFMVRPMSLWFPVLPADYERYCINVCKAVAARNQEIRECEGE